MLPNLEFASPLWLLILHVVVHHLHLLSLNHTRGRVRQNTLKHQLWLIVRWPLVWAILLIIFENSWLKGVFFVLVLLESLEVLIVIDGARFLVFWRIESWWPNDFGLFLFLINALSFLFTSLCSSITRILHCVRKRRWVRNFSRNKFRRISLPETWMVRKMIIFVHIILNLKVILRLPHQLHLVFIYLWVVGYTGYSINLSLRLETEICQYLLVLLLWEHIRIIILEPNVILSVCYVKLLLNILVAYLKRYTDVFAILINFRPLS